jgi:Uma2 family endonuclease
MSSVARKLATYEDLVALPPEVRAEIVDGTIAVQPSASFQHGEIAAGLAVEVRAPFGHGRGGPGGWWITSAFDVRLDAHDVVRPDIVGWRRARMPVKPEAPPADVVPDWICEVLSPSNGRHDRRTKKALYARFGVPHYWIVDPELRLLEAYTLQPSGLWLETGIYDETSRARIAPFDAIELDLANVFPPANEGAPTEGG